jgi:hypothetical protein
MLGMWGGKGEVTMLVRWCGSAERRRDVSGVQPRDLVAEAKNKDPDRKAS